MPPRQMVIALECRSVDQPAANQRCRIIHSYSPGGTNSTRTEDVVGKSVLSDEMTFYCHVWRAISS